MHVDILTLFPEMFTEYLAASILGRAVELDLLSINLINIRDYASGKHRITDEPPYGGGGGMVLKPGPIFSAVEALLVSHDVSEAGISETGVPGVDLSGKLGAEIILLTPQGRIFNQQIARELSSMKRLVLICGRYEGVDERVRLHLATDELSIGDYVLTGGELAAMVVVDAIARLIPGVLGAVDAVECDSFSQGLLEGPHYTRPAEFRGWPVPHVLRSGHAAEIHRWRRRQAIRRTWERRPDLLLNAELDEDEKYFLMELAAEASDQAEKDE